MKYFVFFILSLFCTISKAQWAELSASPSEVFRHDDVFFVNQDTGWVANNQGQIWRTNDGGNSWALQTTRSDTYFRCLAFFDENLGFVGTLGKESWWAGSKNDTALYRTRNGGNTWEPVTTISGDTVVGLCGLQVVNDTVIVGVGRVGGPTVFVRSSDRGETWSSMSMATYAKTLIEPYFTSTDTGFVIGGTEEGAGPSSGVILYTTNGGASWTNVKTTTKTNEWCWKIFFPSNNVGYVSLQSSTIDSVNFLKTTDGGQTWIEKRLANQYWAQGIGFLNDSVGWIGGDLSKTYSLRTVDGGDTWQQVEIGSILNRFRKINDSTMYSCGQRVYKYSNDNPVNPVTNISDETNRDVNLYPVPTQNELNIEIKNGLTKLDMIWVYDYPGRNMEVEFEQIEVNKYRVNTKKLHSGLYLLILKGEELNYRAMFAKE